MLKFDLLIPILGGLAIIIGITSVVFLLLTGDARYLLAAWFCYLVLTAK